MKKLFSVILFVVALFALTSSASAATWNTPYGIGDGNGEGYFSASGVPFSVISSVRSNSVYCILGGPKALGSPLVQSIWIKPDLAAGTLDFFVPTNSWTCASNQPAGTNVIWLTSTNSGLATNDVCVIQHADGTAQMLVIGGNASSSGLLTTNSLGYNAVQSFNSVSNAIQPNDVLYKMALRRSITPFTLQNVTNDVAVQSGQWWQIATRAGAMTFNGVLGGPTLISMTGSNNTTGGGLLLDGNYKRRDL